MAKKTIIFIFALLFLLATSNSSWSDEQESKNLRGIKSIFVVVERLDEEAEKDGLSQAQIQADVELRLRKYGIKITPISDFKNQLDIPILDIIVTTLKPDHSQTYVYGIGIELYEMVSLIRAPNIKIPASTWSENAIGKVGKSKIRQIRDKIIDYVDVFAKDFLSVNE